MYLCFVVDTNPSMRERPVASSSLSALDMAKCGIEQMIFKFRNMGYSNIVDKSMMLLKSGEGGGQDLT
jgi:hypothetical protein